MYEEIVRGTLSELAERFADGARGEIVVVVEGAPASAATDLPSAVATVLEMAAGGIRLKEAAADVAGATGLSTRELYEAATVDLASAVATVLEMAAGGIRLKEAAADVATATGLSTRELYEAAIRAK